MSPFVILHILFTEFKLGTLQSYFRNCTVSLVTVGDVTSLLTEPIRSTLRDTADKVKFMNTVCWYVSVWNKRKPAATASKYHLNQGTSILPLEVCWFSLSESIFLFSPLSSQNKPGDSSPAVLTHSRCAITAQNLRPQVN